MRAHQNNLTCTMCGHTFDPAEGAGCQGCPLQNGCALVRCPACGFENANPEKSRLAHLFRRFFLPRQAASEQHHAFTLADVPAGAQAEVVSFLAGLSEVRQAHLRAYGVTPGSQVHVKQHQPVTVIQVDQTELALETTLAQQVSVKNISRL